MHSIFYKTVNCKFLLLHPIHNILKHNLILNIKANPVPCNKTAFKMEQTITGNYFLRENTKCSSLRANSRAYLSGISADPHGN